MRLFTTVLMSFFAANAFAQYSDTDRAHYTHLLQKNSINLIKVTAECYQDHDFYLDLEFYSSDISIENLKGIIFRNPHEKLPVKISNQQLVDDFAIVSDGNYDLTKIAFVKRPFPNTITTRIRFPRIAPLADLMSDEERFFDLSYLPSEKRYVVFDSNSKKFINHIKILSHFYHWLGVEQAVGIKELESSFVP